MTQRAELQIGKLFRDLDGSVVHLRNIKNDICIWTADKPASDGAYGGATHVDNFRKRFAPAVAVVAAADAPATESASVPASHGFARLLSRLASDRAQISQHVSM